MILNWPLAISFLSPILPHYILLSSSFLPWLILVRPWIFPTEVNTFPPYCTTAGKWDVVWEVPIIHLKSDKTFTGFLWPTFEFEEGIGSLVSGGVGVSQSPGKTQSFLWDYIREQWWVLHLGLIFMCMQLPIALFLFLANYVWWQRDNYFMQFTWDCSLVHLEKIWWLHKSQMHSDLKENMEGNMRGNMEGTMKGNMEGNMKGNIEGN